MGAGSVGLMTVFIVLPVALAAAFVLGVGWAAKEAGLAPSPMRRQTIVAAALVAAWMGFTFAAGASGWLSFTTRPPTMVPVLVVMLAIGLTVGLSRVGERLALHIPLAALVGIQGFRLPLELAMHRAYEEGLMPVQMSFSGYNFDIVTGATALLVAGLLVADRASLWLVRAWNWVGLALLINVVTIAVLSAPLPFRMFHNEPANVWVTQAPYVWLPTVLVLAALLGHILVFRRLRAESTPKGGRSGDSAHPRRAGAQ